MLKKNIKTILPKQVVNKLIEFKNNYLSEYAIKSYSQEGEDMILARLFENQQNGFYIDVGAHHPQRFSNTYFFYKKGWRGINVDAMLGSMKLFNKIRSRDINIERPEFVILNHGDIFANAVIGTGGNIKIIANDPINLFNQWWNFLAWHNRK